MQTATSETVSKSRDISLCVHHYTLRAPCPKGQGIGLDGDHLNVHAVGLSRHSSRRPFSILLFI